MKNFLAAGWLTLLFIAYNSSASIIVDGREWYQPSELSGFAWFEFDAACPESAGRVCSGLLGDPNPPIVDAGRTNPDLSGWIWAGPDDLNALLNLYLLPYVAPSSLLGPGPDFYAEMHGFPGREWALDFLADFLPTNTFGLQSSVSGYLSVLGSQSNLGAVGYVTDIGETGLFDRAGSDNEVPTNSFSPIGGWLYRDVPTAVPLPSTAILLGLGLAGMGFTRRSKTSATIKTL